MTPDNNTLRYFFSSIFQGFAAIFTLTGMFYIFYMDKMDNTLKKIEDKLTQLYKNGVSLNSADNIQIELLGIIHFINDIYFKRQPQKTTVYIGIENYIKAYNGLIDHRIFLKHKLIVLIVNSVIILITSLIALLLVNDGLRCFNMSIFYFGIVIIFYSVWYLVYLGKFIYDCIGMFGKRDE